MQEINHHTTLGEQVIKTLLYFDIFSYPLKANEVFQFLQTRAASEAEVVQCLNALTDKKYIFRFGDFYSLHADDIHVQRRMEGNTEAGRFLRLARSKAHSIGRFPFVRAVMASGSFSKGYMDKDSDLDFFIITEPGRLWIARTLLVLYKRVFLFNSHKHFCVNYFVDASHLEIEEKNLFTATELATLVPLYNLTAYTDLQASNVWLKEFFPNFRNRGTAESQMLPQNIIARTLEVLLNPVARYLDNFFMRLTLRRWNKLYGKSYLKNDFEIAFKSRKHVSKNHPRNYQKKILDLYQGRLVQYSTTLAQSGHE